MYHLAIISHLHKKAQAGSCPLTHFQGLPCAHASPALPENMWSTPFLASARCWEVFVEIRGHGCLPKTEGGRAPGGVVETHSAQVHGNWLWVQCLSFTTQGQELMLKEEEQGIRTAQAPHFLILLSPGILKGNSSSVYRPVSDIRGNERPLDTSLAQVKAKPLHLHIMARNSFD